MSFLIIVFQILALAFLACGIILGVICLWSLSRYKVPFVPVPHKILPDIAAALALKEGDVVYDLGCGDARVLTYLAKTLPNAHLVGIEREIFPRLLAYFTIWLDRHRLKSQVAVLNKDFFTHDLSEATHIFVYLYPQVLDALLSKLERELRPGTRVVSASFKFSAKSPLKRVSTAAIRRYDLAKDLYIYQF